MLALSCALLLQGWLASAMAATCAHTARLAAAVADAADCPGHAHAAPAAPSGTEPSPAPRDGAPQAHACALCLAGPSLAPDAVAAAPQPLVALAGPVHRGAAQPLPPPPTRLERPPKTNLPG